jgi:ribose transport system permease protein
MDVVSSAGPNGGEARSRPRTFIQTHATAALSQVATGGAVLLLVVIMSFASPYFLTSTNLTNIGETSAPYAVMAIGLTFVIITAGIDLSVAAISALAGIIGAKLIVSVGVGPVIGVLGGVGVGAVVGLLNGVLVASAGLAPFITTLGMGIVATGLVLQFSNSLPISLPVSFLWLDSGRLGGFPVAVLFVFGVAIAAHLILTRSKPGRYFYALGSNPEAARLSGISARRYLPLVYVISGALSGFAGMMFASISDSGQPSYDPNITLYAIAAAVIGGASLFGGEGTILGSLLGALLIGVVNNGSELLNISVNWQDVVLGVLIWLAVLFDQARRRRLAAIG